MSIRAGHRSLRRPGNLYENNVKKQNSPTRTRMGPPSPKKRKHNYAPLRVNCLLGIHTGWAKFQHPSSSRRLIQEEIAIYRTVSV
jgi:hypothetical protein